MRTSPAEKDNKILQVNSFLCDEVNLIITCDEATDLADFSLTRDRLPEKSTIRQYSTRVTFTSIIL